jgi:hypothetical protein
MGPLQESSQLVVHPELDLDAVAPLVVVHDRHGGPLGVGHVELRPPLVRVEPDDDTGSAAFTRSMSTRKSLSRIFSCLVSSSLWLSSSGRCTTSMYSPSRTFIWAVSAASASSKVAIVRLLESWELRSKPWFRHPTRPVVRFAVHVVMYCPHSILFQDST